MLMCSLFLCNTHMRPRVRRAPGLPCALSFLEGKAGANLGQIVPRERETASSVIASGAKQSMLPHKERMDCFAPLAMTWLGRGVLDRRSRLRRGFPTLAPPGFCGGG